MTMKANFNILGITRKSCEILRLLFFLFAIYEVTAPLFIIPILCLGISLIQSVILISTIKSVIQIVIQKLYYKDTVRFPSFLDIYTIIFNLKKKEMK